MSTNLLFALVAASIASSVAIGSAAPQTSGAFGGLSGHWAGTGNIVFADSSRQRLRCTADYAVGEDGESLRQTVDCATDSSEFHVNSTITADQGILSGRWNETRNDLSGRIAGHADKGRIQVNVLYGVRIAARMTLAVSGNQQFVKIQTDEFNMKEMSMTLRSIAAPAAKR